MLSSIHHKEVVIITIYVEYVMSADTPSWCYRSLSRQLIHKLWKVLGR